MKTRKRSVLQACLTLALVSVSTAIALADGELDMGFSPPTDLAGKAPRAVVIHGQAYVCGPSIPVRRLREDGSLDQDWQLTAPAGDTINIVGGLPAGGLAVLSTDRLFLDHGDGTYVRSPIGGDTLYSTSLAPQEDNSVVVFRFQNVTRILDDGTVDPGLRIKVRLEALKNPNASGIVIRAAQDSQGRYIISGDFHISKPAERLGVIRLLADGSLDPSWNPAPELGLLVDANRFLNHRVGAITVLPDDSVLLVQENELAWIDNQGKVTRRIPNIADNTAYFRPPIVQPDGKTILAGGFHQWGESPVSGLIRLNRDGSLDSSFQVQLDWPGIDTMTLDFQGRLWIAGYFQSVNGVARAGIARIFAYTPDPASFAAPTVTMTVAPSHVATNEVLCLTARVGGIPEPDLQWFQNGVPLAGTTNRGLRLNITNASDVGTFSLVASNSLGTQSLTFPTVSLAVRSPQPGREDVSFNRALTHFSKIIQMVPQVDGRVLVGSGDRAPDQSLETALVGRLLPNGGLDSSFGQEGVIKGKGRLEALIPLPNGGLLVAGEFTGLGGQAAYGLAEVGRTGRVVPRTFPSLDIPWVSTALPLPDGKLMIAGRFTKVGDMPAYRLARLNADLSLDTSFHARLLEGQFVDSLALDARGRALIAGERIYANATVTNPPPVGLQRLLADGNPDPAFHALSVGVRTIFVEADGKLLVGMPAFRLDEDGNVLTTFEDDQYPYSKSREDFYLLDEANHLMVRTSGGGVIYRALANDFISSVVELWRWKPTGQRDYNFDCTLPPGDFIHKPTAMTALADDSILLNLVVNGLDNLDVARRLHRILPDPDFSLRTKGVRAAQFHVALETQPGLSYEVYQRDQLTGGTATKLGEYSGDGYIIDLQAPAAGNSAFLELRRH